MSVISYYEEQVYAGVLGKVIGVYMGRPFEGWWKHKLVEKWGLIDRYVADDQKVPLVVADDDITGTFTFIRALEDSGRYADTPEEFFGKMWLNYIIENKSILWWGGLGVSTEHTAYLQLKNGTPAPQSGSIEMNGKVVAEQIGAQIFIDAFGMVAPGNPALAVEIARSSARVSHDGEAVNGALVVAAMVSAAFNEKDMEKLLDLAVTYIPDDSLIAQVHRDVRGWCKEDGNWHVTYQRIAEKYGYDSYGGGCHMIPNHAIMVMAWSYAPDNFRLSQAIVNTAGWDTDCNAANVGTVMGIVCGLEGINKDYDFQGPMADRLILPTADGSRHISDCAREARYIANIGRKVMGWDVLPAAKDGAWHDFTLPGSQHGYMAEKTAHGTNGPATVRNADGMLVMDYLEVAPERPARISTPVLLEPNTSGYAIMGTPRLYSGYTVTLAGDFQPACAGASVRLFLRRFVPEANSNVSKTTELIYSDAVTITGPFTLSIDIPDTAGFPVKDFGIEVNGAAGSYGSVSIDSVRYSGLPHIKYQDNLPRNEKSALLGWVVDADIVKSRFSEQKEDYTYFGKNNSTGLIVTGTDEWTNLAITCDFNVHCADKAGIIVRYQGLRRWLGVVKTRTALQLVRCYDDEYTVLAETACEWGFDETRNITVIVQDSQLCVIMDKVELLVAEDDLLTYGGAGFMVERGLAGFRQLEILGK